MTNRESAISVFNDLTLTTTKKTQEASILGHMLSIGPITPLEALTEYGCMRLGARIYDLEHKHPIRIKHELVNNGKKTYMQYSLEDDDDA